MGNRHNRSRDGHQLFALAGTGLVVGDSPTMTAEAMVLGTPSVRINDCVGRLNDLRELEDDSRLGVGLPVAQSGRLLDTIRNLINDPGGSDVFAGRRQTLLTQRINPVNLYCRASAYRRLRQAAAQHSDAAGAMQR